MSDVQPSALHDGATASAPTRIGRVLCHVGIGLAGLLLGVIAGAVVALATGLVPFQC